jgi:hypothetical protein
MAIFFLVVLVTGLLAIVGPAPMAASVVEMSSLVTSRTSDMRPPWAAPKMAEMPVLSNSEFPARADSKVEILPDVATEAHEHETMTVSDSALVPEISSTASIEELVPEEVHAQAEQVDHDVFAASETLAEEALDGEDVANEATQSQTPAMAVSSDSPSTFEVVDSMSVESVEAEPVEDQTILERGDEFEIEAEVSVALKEIGIEVASVPVAPEDVEVEMTSIAVAPEDVEIEVASALIDPIDVEVDVTSGPLEEEDNLVASSDPQIEQVEKSAPQSFLRESPAFCSLVGEKDNEGNDRSMASSPSNVGQVH